VRAIEAYNIHLAAYPDDQVSWNNLGYEFLRSQRWDEAAEAYRRAIVLDSLDDNALVNLATVYNASGQHEEAIDAYARSFDLNPAHRLNTNIVHEYGFNLIALNELEAADEAFRWLLDGNREAQSLGHRSMAMLRLYKGRFADAIEHLEQSVLLDGFGSPPTTALRNRAFLSSAVLRTRGAEAARRVLMPALEILDSAYIAPYFLAPVGMLFAQVGEPGTATVLLDTLAARAGEQNDADQGALQFLAGHIALAREATDSARAHFRRAVIFTNENNPEYLAWLARTQILLGDLDAAQTSLESVVGQATTGREGLEMWVRAHYDLARLHDEAGDTEQAIRWYAAFLDLWDQADEGLDPVPDARQRLASLTADRR
jgi:tetratricopeptide (TPR) repeat protein